jgi:hypothetical protein
MSLLDKIFGRRLPGGTISRVVEVVRAVVDGARDLSEMRERLARKARAGDLDFLLDHVARAQAKARAFERDGSK